MFFGRTYGIVYKKKEARKAEQNIERKEEIKK
jgi:hypothetical protein